MLNLVQLQERLKDVPMQALMQYANGANPQVPPFLALTELNRRKKMQEGAAAEQAKEMEGAPTVKEQIEQAAGLIALQGNRQQQAARQQAGIQAAMPMAAPNTTTSEPAQLAGGGFIEDIVVPRDFQMGGGVMNPEMMKKMMMMKAMQSRRRPPGLAGIPLPQDMFKRSDYANGGIVAFQNGGSTFESNDDVLERKSSTTIPEALRIAVDAIKKGIAGGGDPNLYSREVDADKEKQRRTRIRGLSDAQQSMIEDARDRAMSQIMAGPKVTRIDQPSAPPTARTSDIGGLPGAPEAVSRFLGLDPQAVLPDIPETTAAAFRRNLLEANREFGVSADPFKERKRRYGEIEAEDKRRRAEQPMDQLGAFLSGIAEARGGNIFTQGAKGSRASRELRAQQADLNRKQDLDMAALMGAIEDKEDALSRGDRDKFLAAQQVERDARRNLAKDRLALSQNQAQLANQSLQARASMASALKLSPDERDLALFIKDPVFYEKYRQARSMGDETLALRREQAVEKRLKEDPMFMEYRLLALDSDPKKQRQAADIRARAYAEAGVPLPGSSSMPGVVVTPLSK